MQNILETFSKMFVIKSLSGVGKIEKNIPSILCEILTHVFPKFRMSNTLMIF